MEKDTLEYQKKLVEALRSRNDQLVAEIHRLKGYKPLSEEFIKKHNIKVKIVAIDQ